METKRGHKNVKFTEEHQAFIQFAGLIIPYLLPADLASASSTCKAIRDISKSVTLRRSCDAARSFESNPIPFFNSIDQQSYFYFIYTPTQTLSTSSSNSSDVQVQPWGYDPGTRPDLLNPRFPDPFLFRVKGAKGCACEGKCERALGCPCFDDEEMLSRECGPSCGCGMGCGNRVTQGGISVKLKILKDRRKGWGLYADEFIPKGRFVCEYAGELLTTKEARSRQQIYDNLAISGQLSPALLVVKEHLPSGDVCLRMNVDATRVGNAARFINHSCDGGNVNAAIVRSSGSLVPRICFFASRDIHHHEELCFSYGDIRLKKQGLPCFCGSSSCHGILPSETI